MVLAIIVARGGSTELPNKNVRTCGGRPLIAHTIEHAQVAELVDGVCLSTDSEEIRDVARRMGVDILIDRPHHLARNEVMWPLILQHALDVVESRTETEVEIVVALSPTFPFRDSTLIDCAVDKLRLNKNIDGCLSMVRNHNQSWIYKNGRYTNLTEGFLEPRPRQERVPLYDCCFGLGSAIRADILQGGIPLENVDIVVPEDPACAIDINTQFDLDLADSVFERRNSHENLCDKC